ncbi:TauD/TfdA family dioxygenase [Mycobacterium sp. NAZ190054]|uniref:TauD/TfdA dioxygenase family protein n=1 Tax=Mycobacterium sp. NAZ190054 TaxID=1747766 RepID=UPI00079A1CE5|nr:TauD/TfdA family dioxygenase [Mycobacterium sp. NAZ190054]KWX66124.1 hypothetical protein ASJ79_06625 [Mycobacterium sp. NAZ190054]
MATMTYATRECETLTLSANGIDPIIFRPLGGTFGAVVEGVDLASELSEAVQATLVQALNVYSLLCFPDQHLKPADQMRVVSIFGEIGPRYAGVAPADGDWPDVRNLSNIVNQDGTRVGEANMRGMEWHTDGSGFRHPNKATTLYAVEVPETGGETYFANGYLAYEMLDAQTKAMVDGMTCTFSWVTLQRWLAEADGDSSPLPPEQAAEFPDIRRPLVRTHPVTGRKALWFSIEEVIDIDGMGRERTREFLQGLLDRITSTPHLMYRHDWRLGDFVIWDNRCLLHSVSEYNYAGAAPPHAADQHRRLL